MDNHPTTFSVETLLDALMVLYDECCTSSFKKEKTVQDFSNSGEQSELSSYFVGCSNTPPDVHVESIKVYKSNCCVCVCVCV